MNKILLVLGILVILASCDLFNNSPKKPPEPVLESLTLKVTNTYSVEGAPIPIGISVSAKMDDGSNGLSPEYQLYANEDLLSDNQSFSPERADLYNIYAESEGIRSDTIQIEVRRPRSYEPKEFNIIFHIVHDGEEVGEGYNISKGQIDYQMSLLKAVFEKEDVNYSTNSTYPAMSFKFATVDPLGNKLLEPGINRFQRPSVDHSVLFEEWMWDHYWDPDYYINIWVGDTKNGFSWGIYPELSCDSNLGGLGCTDALEPATIQGIALELSNLWEGNWVLPHEMGHIFGLFHVFGSDKCLSDPDLLNDTPYYNRDNYILDLNPNKSSTYVYRKPCNELGLAEYVSYNIMDYHYQPTNGRDLTYDQVERMRYVVERGRFRASKNPETGNPRKAEDFRNKKK